MTKRYGVPYGMSKNRIAKALIDYFPSADTFIDIMAGGCAVAHAALESGKYKHVIVNDLNPLPTKMFIDAIGGKYKNERRAVDRETFKRLRDTDPYVKYCWGYGNKGTTYIYGKQKEPLRVTACRMIMADESELPKAREDFQTMTERAVKETDLDFILKPDDWRERLARFTKHVGKIDSLKCLKRLAPMTQLAALSRMNLDINKHALARLQEDYRDVPIPENSIIYCDIPYKGLSVVSDMGMKEFNHSEFCDWACEQNNIYISSYEMPEDRFEKVHEIPRQAIMKKNDGGKVIEKLFVPRRCTSL